MKHRTALVTALSICGVLIAGISAVGANVGILASAESDGIGSATPTTAAIAAVPALATSSSDTTVTTASEAELFAYEVEGVGVVMLERGDDGIEVAAIDAPGWSWDLSGGGTRVVVTLVQGGSEIVFEARLVGDQIQVAVEDRTPTYSGDDHDDDQYEGHDDDQYEGHDDDHDDDQDEDHEEEHESDDD